MPVQQSISCFENPPLDPEATWAACYCHQITVAGPTLTELSARRTSRSHFLSRWPSFGRAQSSLNLKASSPNVPPTSPGHRAGPTTRTDRLKVPDPQELLESEINFR